jgi:hypothetical protein
VIRIYDRIDECDDGKYRARSEAPKGITLHTFCVPTILDAAGISRWYQQNTQYTGGQMPYTIVARGDGRLERALPLMEVGPHAKRWSSSTIGVVALQDGNAQPPPMALWDALVELCAEFCSAFGWNPLNPVILAGHTEPSRPGSTNWPGKVCPGRFWDMGKFRSDVDEIQRNMAIQRLVDATIK